MVSWNASSGATGYNLVVSQDGKHSWTRVVDGQNVTAYTVTGVDHTLVYHVAVQATNANGDSAWNTSGGIHPTDVIPGPPKSLSASRTQGSISVSWSPPDNASYVVGAIGYDINYSTDHKNSWTRHSSNQSGTSTTITADNSMTWYVAVRAVTSAAFSGWTTSGPIEANFLVLPAPASVTISGRGLNGFTVGWSAVNNAQGYNVNVSADGGYNWTRLASGTTGASLAVNSSISGFSYDSGATYLAAVQAVDQGVGGTWRNSAASTPTYPPGPPIVTATRGLTTITVAWTAPADDGGSAITGYDVNMSDNGGVSWTREHSNVSGTSATVSGVNNATDYIVAVRARNAAGEGNWANSATVEALAAPSVTAYRGANFIDVEWTSVADATGYKVDYSLDGGANWTTAFLSLSISTQTVRIGGTSQLSIPNADGHAVRVTPVNTYGYGVGGVANVGFAFKPLAVTNVSATRVTSGELDVTWNTCDTTDQWCSGGSPITDYVINLSSDGGFSWTRAKTIPVADFTSGGTVTLTGVDDSTAYRVSVSMRNRVGGQWVNADVAAATTAQLRVPRNLNSGNTFAHNIITTTFRWEKPAGASATDAFSYEIECNSATITDWSFTTCPSDVASTSDQHNSSVTSYGIVDPGIRAARIRANSSSGSSLWVYIFPTPIKPTIAAQYHDGALKVWWDRPSAEVGATAYEVQCTTDTSTPYTWTDCHTEAASLTASFYVSPTASGTVTKVRMRARQGQRVSEWTGATSVPSDIAPAAPGNIAVTSVSSNGTIVSYAISWDKPSNTASRPVSYVIECSTDGGTTWITCKSVAATSTATGVTATAQHTAIRDSYTHVRIRGDEGYLRGVWSSAVTTASLAVTDLTSTGANLTIANNLAAAWYYKADAGPDTSCSSIVAAGTATEALTGLTPGASYTYTAYADSACTGTAIATTGAFTVPITFTATSITNASATLSLPGYPTAWSHKRTAGPSSTTCTNVGAGTTTSALSSLTGNTLYGYTAYSGSGCTDANKLKSVHFSTSAYGVGNIDEGPTTQAGCSIGYSGSNTRCAVAFTAGSTSDDDYTLKSVSGLFLAKVGTPASLAVTIHADNSGSPNAATLATLSGADPDTAGVHTYTCSGSGCTLTAGDTYFVVMSMTGSGGLPRYYSLLGTTSDDQTNYPTTGTWSIANVGLSKSGANAWTNLSSSWTPLIHIAASGVPALTVSNIKETTATLNLANHSGDWYYKANVAPDTSCSSAVSATTKALTGLTVGTSYTYSAYSDSGCTTLIDAAPAFTTGGAAVSISNLTQSSNGNTNIRGTRDATQPFTTGANAGGYTLNSIIVDMSAAEGSPGTLVVTLREDSSNNPGTTKATLTLKTGDDPLTAGQATYTCPSSCDLNANTKYHIVLAASTATSGNQYRWRTVSGTSATLTPSGNGWSYVVGRSNYAGWQTISGAHMLKVSTTAKVGLTASSVAQTTATLTLSNYGTKAWWYQGNQSNAPCTSVASGTTTASLSTLSASTSYTYKAYNASGCSSANEIASVAFTTPAADYDVDDDGLIEVSNLAQLNAIRYDLDGNGTVDNSANSTSYNTAFPNAKSNMGCNEDETNPAACSGYELAANLDFDTDGDDTADSGDTYWNSGNGWDPIGNGSTAYTGDFDGNSDTDTSGDGGPYTIDNLYINRSQTTGQIYVGLFGVVGSGAEIERVSLTGVSVAGTMTGNSSGNDEVYAGALAGRNQGTISKSSSAGAVTGSRTGGGVFEDAFVGGLVGGNAGVISASSSGAAVTAIGHRYSEAIGGGLVGENERGGSIIGSYATGTVTANRGTETGNLTMSPVAGGLVGHNQTSDTALDAGVIIASYATGNVTADGWRTSAGGLVGNNRGPVTASYSTGTITATGSNQLNKGGLIANNDTSTITDSYWDTTTSGESTSAGGTGKTTSELQSPTGYSGIYAHWNIDIDDADGDNTTSTGTDDPWDFGTSSQYPVLKYGGLNVSGQR